MATQPTDRIRAQSRWIFSWMLTAIAAMIVMPAPAHAYLDPATGSMIIQIVTGSVLGALLIVKTYWRRIKGYFSSDTTSLEEEPRRFDDPD